MDHDKIKKHLDRLAERIAEQDDRLDNQSYDLIRDLRTECDNQATRIVDLSEARSSADSAQPVAWRVDGIRQGKEQVWFYWKPEWPGLHEEQGDKVTPLYDRPARTEPQTAPSDIERAFQDACDEAGCAYDNEALLEAIHALKERCQAGSDGGGK